MKLNVLLDEGAFMPEKAHDADAGFDLRTPVSFWLNPGDEIVIDTGVHIEIPKGYVGFLKSKSGLNVNYGITGEGVIDSGYTGSIRVKLYRSSQLGELGVFEAGDKITQLVILPIPDVEMVIVDEFHETERGNNGFGSSGR
jgi:dUTP pyrophosphatase